MNKLLIIQQEMIVNKGIERQIDVESYIDRHQFDDLFLARKIFTF